MNHLSPTEEVITYACCFQCISCTSFKVLGFILRFLIQFELILVQGEKHGSGLFSAWRYPVFPATFVEEAVVNYSLSEDS
jgi:hypothetical protein